jgi:hypothetical protein
MSSNKVVRVSYTVDDVFCVPKNINLEDKTQVESWGVKYNRLYIYLTNGKKLEISSRGWIESFDYKYPNIDEQKILDAEEVCIDDDDEGFEEADVETGEKKKEETEKQEVYSVMQMYSSPKGNAGECKTICRFETLEDAKEFWKDYCECNSTQEHFAKTGFNCFYITDKDGMVEEAHDTGFFDPCDEMFDEESDEEEEDSEDKCDCCGEDANAGLINGKFVCITCREDCCDDEEDDL